MNTHIDGTFYLHTTAMSPLMCLHTDFPRRTLALVPRKNQMCCAVSCLVLRGLSSLCVRDRSQGLPTKWCLHEIRELNHPIFAIYLAPVGIPIYCRMRVIESTPVAHRKFLAMLLSPGADLCWLSNHQRRFIGFGPQHFASQSSHPRGARGIRH
jgi:hypothetical protein